MQQPQEHEASLSISEQLPSSTPVESQKVEPAPRSSQGLFAAFENASLKTQQLVTAITAAVISFLAVVAIIQFSAKTILQPGSTALSQLTAIGLAALVTAVAVGATTFALGQITTSQINRSIDNLQAQFNAVVGGDLGVQATVYSPKELGQLAMSFNQMSLAINTMLSDAQRKAEEQEKAKEEVEHKLIQFLRNVEENFGSDLPVQAEETTSEEEENERAIAPQGPLLEFIHYLQTNSTLRGNFDLTLFLGSNTLEDIQRHKDDLHYREAWLEALLEETQRELKFIALIIQKADKKQHRATNEG